MWSQYAGVQASMTLNGVGAILLELRASYSAIERGIIRPVKTCQEKTNFPEHLLWKTLTNLSFYVLYFLVLLALFQSLVCPLTRCNFF